MGTTCCYRGYRQVYKFAMGQEQSSSNSPFAAELQFEVRDVFGTMLVAAASAAAYCALTGDGQTCNGKEKEYLYHENEYDVYDDYLYYDDDVDDDVYGDDGNNGYYNDKNYYFHDDGYNDHNGGNKSFKEKNIIIMTTTMPISAIQTTRIIEVTQENTQEPETKQISTITPTN